MTVSDLFRVSAEGQWIKIIHEGFIIYEGRFEVVLEFLLDCTIKSVEPSYNSYTKMFVIELM